MTRRLWKNFLLLPLLGLLFACVTPMTLAPSTEPLEPGDYTVLGPADGSSTGFYILFFIPVSTRSSAEDAIKDALEETNGEALINVTGDVTMTCLFVFNFVTTRIYGDAVDVHGR